MSTGAIIFAFNGDIEYTRIAQECAKRIKQHLNIPVTLITNSVRTYSGFDNQILVEGPNYASVRSWADCDTSVTWRNGGRCDALELSPYETTLLVDADYWIEDDTLQCLLEADGDLYAHNTRQYINETAPKTETFGLLKTKMWWATVVVFRKTSFTADVFDVWRMVEQNYKHYSQLFQFQRKPFRNDYALSLALLLCNGNLYPTECAIPWPLINVPDNCSIDYTQNVWTVGYDVYESGELKPKQVKLKDQNLHVMGKRNLEKLLELHR